MSYPSVSLMAVLLLFVIVEVVVVVGFTLLLLLLSITAAAALALSCSKDCSICLAKSSAEEEEDSFLCLVRGDLLLLPFFAFALLEAAQGGILLFHWLASFFPGGSVAWYPPC